MQRGEEGGGSGWKGGDYRAAVRIARITREGSLRPRSPAFVRGGPPPGFGPERKRETGARNARQAASYMLSRTYEPRAHTHTHVRAVPSGTRSVPQGHHAALRPDPYYFSLSGASPLRSRSPTPRGVVFLRLTTPFPPPPQAHARITQKRINNTRESASMKSERREGRERDRSRLTAAAVVHVGPPSSLVVNIATRRGAARRRISRSPPWYTHSRTHPTGGKRHSGRELRERAGGEKTDVARERERERGSCTRE